MFTSVFQLFPSAKFLFPFVILLFFVTSLMAQRHSLNYKVVHKNNKIGWIKIHKDDSAGHSSIVLHSEINKRIIFLLSVIEKQEVTFDNSGMTRSLIYRRVNSDVKMNRQTSFKGGYYEVKDEGSLQKLMLSRIKYNLLSMYYTEPVNISAVYSDTFKRYLAIEAKGNASYKVALPDGNNNYYFYTNGVCSRIIVEHSLFSVEFIRV